MSGCGVPGVARGANWPAQGEGARAGTDARVARRYIHRGACGAAPVASPRPAFATGGIGQGQGDCLFESFTRSAHVARCRTLRVTREVTKANGTLPAPARAPARALRDPRDRPGFHEAGFRNRAVAGTGRRDGPP